MKWLLRKKINLDKNEGSRELQEVKQELRQVRSRWPEVNRLVSRLGTLTEENHFSQLITDAMQGGKE